MRAARYRYEHRGKSKTKTSGKGSFGDFSSKKSHPPGKAEQTIKKSFIVIILLKPGMSQ